MTITAEPRIEPEIPEVTSAFEAYLDVSMANDVPNAVLAYEVLDLIRANPEHLYMGRWVWKRSAVPGMSLQEWCEPVTLETVTQCGTAACFAGWTVLASGKAIDPVDERVIDAPEPGGRFRLRKGLSVALLAKTLLNIDEGAAANLFYSRAEELEAKVQEVFGPDPRKALA